MLLRRAFFLFLMVAFAFSSVAAQLNETDSEREAREKRDAEMFRQYQLRSLPAPDLSAFLPAEQNSWLISIVVHEAWAKTSKITATVKSDGSFLCREEDLAQVHPVNPTDFTNLTALIGEVPKGMNPAYEAATECKTCTVETLQFSFRTKKNKVKTYVYNLDNYSSNFSAPAVRIRSIYNAVKNAAKCGEEIKTETSKAGF